jgi:hypothetical protein
MSGKCRGQASYSLISFKEGLAVLVLWLNQIDTMERMGYEYCEVLIFGKAEVKC